jgi:hypothetical protein
MAEEAFAPPWENAARSENVALPFWFGGAAAPPCLAISTYFNPL